LIATSVQVTTAPVTGRPPNVVRGWRVLRFAWEDVMHDPA